MYVLYRRVSNGYIPSYGIHSYCTVQYSIPPHHILQHTYMLSILSLTPHTHPLPLSSHTYPRPSVLPVSYSTLHTYSVIASPSPTYSTPLLLLSHQTHLGSTPSPPPTQSSAHILISHILTTTSTYGISSASEDGEFASFRFVLSVLAFFSALGRFCPALRPLSRWIVLCCVGGGFLDEAWREVGAKWRYEMYATRV